MKLGELINLAEERDLSKTYPKADGVYIWDYKTKYGENFKIQLELIPSDSGKAGFKDKVSIQEIVDYLESEKMEEHIMDLEIVGVEDITIAKI